MDHLLYGVAYYEEYMPKERLKEDIKMMQRAGINTVRIAESTWSTCEPQDGVFDFSHVERVLDAMEESGIQVIVGTPTYAIPAWMVKSHPDVLATTERGRGIYGARQIMDITNPTYLFYAERVIRKLMECTAHRKCVIGFQIDNETKHYRTAGKNVQERFVKYLRKKFHNNLDAMNREFGLDYWSNRIDEWEDFPDVRGTINGSLGAEFEKFQRSLVDEFLSWQASIVTEYKREDQFITHNFDLEWRGYSFGVQPDVNHAHASKCLTIAGIDLYHPSQDNLTGNEIAFGGDLARSLKEENYLLLETEAQGFPNWLPYPGQLRLQAYSHIASGSNSVMYWHWHSLHNAIETYWKGLLSHDFEENETYREACRIGKEFAEIGKHLVNLKKTNQIAILLNNESLTALKWFPIHREAGLGDFGYNDVVRWIYDTLYHMNVECDFIWPESKNWERYDLVIVPALYAAADALLQRLNDYVEAGGNLVMTFKSAFANENVKVSHEIQPHIVRSCLGIKYHQFTYPKNTVLVGDLFHGKEGENEAKGFMELLIPDGANVLAWYKHDSWKNYAAVTQNRFGKGTAFYIGCMTSESMLREILRHVLREVNLEHLLSDIKWPVAVRKGRNQAGNLIRFYFNYSAREQSVNHKWENGRDILSEDTVEKGEEILLSPWGVRILEYQTTEE